MIKRYTNLWILYFSCATYTKLMLNPCTSMYCLLEFSIHHCQLRRYIWTGEDTLASVPPLFEESSQVKLSLLIWWHFISPKHIFYFIVDKEASACGGLCPPSSLPWLFPRSRWGTSIPRLAAIPPNYGDRSTPMIIAFWRASKGVECFK